MSQEILYSYRKLLNSEEFSYWLESNNIIDPIDSDSLHLTVAHSKNTPDFFKPDDFLLLVPQANRKIKVLGTTLVLAVSSNYLEKRWKYYIDNGCIWDYDSYIPHISLSYNNKNCKNAKLIEPFSGNILLSGEYIEQITER